MRLLSLLLILLALRVATGKVTTEEAENSPLIHTDPEHDNHHHDPDHDNHSGVWATWAARTPPPLPKAYVGSVQKNGTLILSDGNVVSKYLNRELSWLAFNERVLSESESKRHPLLERVRFLSISFNNLDEFYMVRVAGLAQLVRNNLDVVSEDGFTPFTQLAQVTSGARSLMNDQHRVWSLLQAELRDSRVARVVSVKDLSAEDKAFLHNKFLTELWPQLTPQSIDNAHPFPFVPNKGMGLALTLTKIQTKEERAPEGQQRKPTPWSVPHKKSSGGGEGGGGGGGKGGRKGKRSVGEDARDLYSAEGRSRSGIDSISEDAIPHEMRAIILLPQKVSRFIRLPDTLEAGQVSGRSVSNSSNTAGLGMEGATRGGGMDGGSRFVLLEDMLSTLELKAFFPERVIKEKGMFRVLRDSEVEVDEEAVDLVRMFETALKRRRKGAVIRLDVEASMPEGMRKWLTAKMALPDEGYLYLQNGLVGLVDVSQVISPSVAGASARGGNLKGLVYPPFQERMPERVTRDSGGDIFAAIQRKDIIVHHPFESFQTVLLFLRQAARDPNVVAIKQTLYRTSEDSPIVQSLIEAAESGKTVTALIELKARFDEEANIRWAKDLERAGVHVVYGFRELKTHAKVSLVVRREHNGLQIYVHLATGNYHPTTAKVYTDLSLFTANPVIGRDATRLFNFCSAYSTASLEELEVIAVAPYNLRSTLESLIRQEMVNARNGLPAHIMIKCNALVDVGMIDLLYQASEAGVNVSAVVRGMCALRPGIPGLSSRIQVKSIVGRFLEHSRVYVFAAGHTVPSQGNIVYISSADLMTRNLDWRVEALVPILNPTVHRQVLNEILIQNELDEANSWELKADGEYIRTQPSMGEEAGGHSAHHYFLTHESLSGKGGGVNLPTKPRRQRETDL